MNHSIISNSIPRSATKQVDFTLVSVPKGAEMLAAVYNKAAVQNRPKMDNIDILEGVTKIVCEYFELEIEQVKAKGRKAVFVRARQIISYIIRRDYEREISLMMLGAFFDQDHTTQIHSVRTVKNYIDTELEFRVIINEISNKIFLSL